MIFKHSFFSVAKLEELSAEDSRRPYENRKRAYENRLAALF